MDNRKIVLTEEQIERLKEAAKRAISEAINDPEIPNAEQQPIREYRGYIVLRHDSNNRITNGVIYSRRMTKNAYSSNSDAGNYFWASERPGRDNSNAASIHYYCLVPKGEVYDFRDNPKGYKTVKEALANERFVAKQWHDGAVVVVSDKPTPISFIKYDGAFKPEDNGVYDAKWHMLRAGVRFHDENRNRQLASKIKRYRDIEVPEFIRGYTYDELIG